MLRIIFVFFFLWVFTEISAQTVPVSKSTDIVVIRGISYYLHTVQPGQTLYSICKAYGVGVEEMKTLNEKKDNSLSLYEVLKVPYIEPFVQKDDRYYYHKVAKGETLYSIARKYGIKPKRLLKYNENYSHNEPLSVGAVIRLPWKEIDRNALKLVETNAVEPVRGEAKQEAEKQEETDNLTPEAEGLGQPDRTIRVQGENEGKDTTAYRRDTVFSYGKTDIPEYITEVVMPADPYVKIALLLPFFSRDYPAFADTLQMQVPVKIAARSDQFLAFYEGILLAVDSLKNQGYKIDLHVFDTERNVENTYLLAGEINRLHPDLIIGPVYGSVYKAMAQSLSDKQIPIIYPLSSRSEGVAEYANFVQVNPSFEALTAAMSGWLAEQGEQANIVCLEWTMENEYSQTDRAEQQAFKSRLQQLGNVNFFEWNTGISLDTMRLQLLPDRENIIVVPATKEAEVSKILPMLSALTDGYRITVVGLPEWQAFTSVDHETYYKLNTKLFTYSYVDYATPAARRLTEKYRKYFYTDPHSLMYKAFDMGVYFIGLAARYRDRTLDAIEFMPSEGIFSRFYFQKLERNSGKGNSGFFIVNYSSDYTLRIKLL